MIKMHKTGKLIALGATVAGVALALPVILLLTWDWDRSRPWINDKVSQAVGREFAIRGPLQLDWQRSATGQGWRSALPWPRLIANDVVLKNPDWAARPYFVTLEQVHVDVSLLPLLHKQVAVTSLTLVKPAIDLERLADGRINWTLRTKPDQSSGWSLQLDQITFAAGRVTLADRLKKIDAVAEIRPIGETVALGTLFNKTAAAQSAPAPSGIAQYGFQADIKGTYNKAPLNGSGQFGGILSLADNHQPFPLQADVRLGDNHIAVAGSITNPGQIAAVDLQLQLAAGSMSELYELTGITLPDTPPFFTRGHLTGQLSRQESHFKYDQFTGRVGGSDLAGTLDYRTAVGTRPSLAGTVRSEKLLLSDLGPLIGVSGKDASTGLAVKEVPGRAIPAAPFRTERWKKMDADIHFTGKQIVRAAALPVNDVSAHIILADGVLTLKPLQFGVAGGSLSGQIVLDGSADPLRGNFSLSARGLRLKQLFPTFAPMETSFGQINGDATLSASGNTPAALAATLDGEMRLLLNDGAISGTLLEQAGLNVANIVLAKLFGDKTVKINCAAAEFVVKKGVLDSRVFALDTADALINVDGTVNLGNEQMDLNVHPHTKGFRIFSLRSPLYVKGTFKNPQVGVAVGPLAARGAAAVGLGLLNPFAALFALVAPSNNSESPCPAMIASASSGMKAAARK